MEAWRTVQPERLTWVQIRERHPDEWVVLVEVEWLDDDDFCFRTAVVLEHGRGRAEVLRRCRHRLGEGTAFGHFFTGALRSDLAPQPDS